MTCIRTVLTWRFGRCVVKDVLIIVVYRLASWLIVCVRCLKSKLATAGTCCLASVKWWRQTADGAYTTGLSEATARIQAVTKPCSNMLGGTVDSVSRHRKSANV